MKLLLVEDDIEISQMLTNLWKPTGGNIELFGKKLTPTSYEVLKRIGSIIEFPTFYDHLSGKENLALHQEYMGYYNPGSIENTLELLHLTDAGAKPVRDFSLGMKQKTVRIYRSVLVLLANKIKKMLIMGLSIGQPLSVSQEVFKSENKGNIKLFRKAVIRRGEEHDTN